jgi:signal transduction histidine kinase
MRRIATELRPPVLDALGLSDAIEWSVEEFRARSRIRCRLVMQMKERPLAPDRALALFRILQEALTNVAKHAMASQVTVRLKRQRAQIVLQVRDNGRGIGASEESEAKGLGILGMRERAISVGGELTIARARDRGTIVTARIPAGDTGPPDSVSA